MITSLLSSILVAGTQSAIAAHLPAGLKDVQFSISIVRSSPKELSKIDDDYRKQYSFNNATVYIKDPFKLRINGNLDDTNLTMIINGTTKLFKVPSLRLSQRTNLQNSPGQRQTWLDFGALTSAVANELFDPTFVRIDRETGDAVFDLRYPPSTGDKTRMRVWINKTGKYLSRREWYGRNGDLKGVFVFSSPVSSGGQSFPGRMQAYTADGKLAGEMKFEQVRINSGLSDDLFKI